MGDIGDLVVESLNLPGGNAWICLEVKTIPFGGFGRKTNFGSGGQERLDVKFQGLCIERELAEIVGGGDRGVGAFHVADVAVIVGFEQGRAGLVRDHVGGFQRWGPDVVHAELAHMVAGAGPGRQGKARIAPPKGQVAFDFKLFAGFFDDGEIGDVKAERDLDWLAAGEGMLAQMGFGAGGGRLRRRLRGRLGEA